MKFKFISLRALVESTRETMHRFPLITFFLIVGAVNNLYMDVFKKTSFEHYSYNLFLSILILVPVLYSIQLFFESKLLTKKFKAITEIFAILLAIVYFRSLPDSHLSTGTISQFGVLLAMSFLLTGIAIKDYFRNDDVFWHFNVALVVRMVMALLYTGVILGGSATALYAIDTLFKTKLCSIQEIRIVIITLWIFTPLIFLTGIPRLNTVHDLMKYRPIWLKNIGLYILLPLTTIYSAILYAYMAKILLQWKLPDGMVSSLILSFAAFGILSLITIFPFQKDANSKWSYWFSRCFYYLQFPLLVLLAIAIQRRIADYGITFGRYYVVCLAIWLLCITVFMVIRKNRNLVVIPLSLFIIALLSSFGPWSAVKVSCASQKSRLVRILNNNKLLDAHKLGQSRNFVPNKTQRDICSIVKYLDNYGRLQTLSELTDLKSPLTPKLFVEQLGFQFKEPWQFSIDEEFYSYTYKKDFYAIKTTDYPIFVKFNYNDYPLHGNKHIELNDVKIDYCADSQYFTITNNKNQHSRINIKTVILQFKNQTAQDNDSVGTFNYNDSLFSILCFFNNLSGKTAQDTLSVYTIHADFLIRGK
jgi:hypothetical protein